MLKPIAHHSMALGALLAGVLMCGPSVGAQARWAGLGKQDGKTGWMRGLHIICGRKGIHHTLPDSKAGLTPAKPCNVGWDCQQ